MTDLAYLAKRIALGGPYAAETDLDEAAAIYLGESAAGDIAPRQVLILVEWESRTAFESYRKDPALADLHPHREQGTSA